MKDKVMKRIVRVPYLVWCNVEIETDETDEDEIISEAMGLSGLCGYAGNGAMSGKLIGTSEPDVTIEACSEPFEEGNIKIEVDAGEE